MNNLEIRQLLLIHNLRHWRVAEEIGINSYTFSVWLRHELTPERKARVMTAIPSALNRHTSALWLNPSEFASPEFL